MCNIHTHTQHRDIWYGRMGMGRQWAIRTNTPLNGKNFHSVSPGKRRTREAKCLVLRLSLDFLKVFFLDWFFRFIVILHDVYPKHISSLSYRYYKSKLTLTRRKSSPNLPLHPMDTVVRKKTVWPYRRREKFAVRSFRWHTKNKQTKTKSAIPKSRTFQNGAYRDNIRQEIFSFLFILHPIQLEHIEWCPFCSI